MLVSLLLWRTVTGGLATAAELGLLMVDGDDLEAAIPFAENADGGSLPIPPLPFDPDVVLAQKIQDPAIETVDEMTARPSAARLPGERPGGRQLVGLDPRSFDPHRRRADLRCDQSLGEGVVRPDQHPGLHAVSHQQRALERREPGRALPSG